MPVALLPEIRPAPPSPAPAHPKATTTPPTPNEPADGESPFARLMHSLGHEAARGESAVKGALAATRAGKDLGGAELLALQAGIYRYSEAVDLAAKLVDRATNGVKTVIQGQ